MKKSGEVISGQVISGHCTCMAGLSEMCNHVGAVLYKCMQQASEQQSSTSLPNPGLPARKSVAPVSIKDVKFGLTNANPLSIQQSVSNKVPKSHQL